MKECRQRPKRLTKSAWIALSGFLSPLVIVWGSWTTYTQAGVVSIAAIVYGSIWAITAIAFSSYPQRTRGYSYREAIEEIDDLNEELREERELREKLQATLLAVDEDKS